MPLLKRLFGKSVTPIVKAFEGSPMAKTIGARLKRDPELHNAVRNVPKSTYRGSRAEGMMSLNDYLNNAYGNPSVANFVAHNVIGNRLAAQAAEGRSIPRAAKWSRGTNFGIGQDTGSVLRATPIPDFSYLGPEPSATLAKVSPYVGHGNWNNIPITVKGGGNYLASGFAPINHIEVPTLRHDHINISGPSVMKPVGFFRRLFSDTKDPIAYNGYGPDMHLFRNPAVSAKHELNHAVNYTSYNPMARTIQTVHKDMTIPLPGFKGGNYQTEYQNGAASELTQALSSGKHRLSKYLLNEEKMDPRQVADVLTDTNKTYDNMVRIGLIPNSEGKLGAPLWRNGLHHNAAEQEIGRLPKALKDSWLTDTIRIGKTKSSDYIKDLLPYIVGTTAGAPALGMLANRNTQS